MSRQIAFFDFDGTITNRDSLADLIRFIKGRKAFYIGLIAISPWLLLFSLGWLDRQKAKEKMLSHFFGGTPLSAFNEHCHKYSLNRISQIVNPQAMDRLLWHKKQGHEVVIVSASPLNWLAPWCHENGFACIATRLETSDGKITGRIDGLNCHGEEKVRRISQTYDLGRYDDIYGYGDTHGDKPMLSLAHHAFYKPFRRSKITGQTV